MRWDVDDEGTSWKVVVNREEQYSIWPADGKSPGGWREVGVTGTRTQCLAHIGEVWTDMRPLSLRKSMASSVSSEKVTGVVQPRKVRTC